MRKVNLAVVACLTLALWMVAVPAGAHYLNSDWITTWGPDNGRCVDEYVELSHDPAQDPGGYHGTGVETWSLLNAGIFPFDCRWAYQNPKRVRLIVYKETSPGSGSFGICKDSGDKQYAQIWRQELLRHYGATAPCGPGNYSTHGINYASYAGVWRGGTIALHYNTTPWYHYLPQTGAGTPGGVPCVGDVIRASTRPSLGTTAMPLAQTTYICG